jgi:hypothetical protein
MRYGIIIACCLVAACLVGGPAQARVDIGLNLNFSAPLEWAPVPGLPVSYATNAPANIFQYNGQYYVYNEGVWYVGPTYNGPWMEVVPEFVPAILLRVPVTYYRVPPPHWHAWHAWAPPRWEVIYGPAWAHHRPAWRRPAVVARPH